MIGWAIAAVVAVSLVWLGYHIVKKYQESEGTFWERLLAGFKDSATILVAGATYVGGAIVGLIGKVADAASMPEVSEGLKALPTEYVGGAFMVLALLVFIARLRSL